MTAGEPTANELAYAGRSPFAHQPRWGPTAAYMLADGLAHQAHVRWPICAKYASM